MKKFLLLSLLVTAVGALASEVSLEFAGPLRPLVSAGGGNKLLRVRVSGDPRNVMLRAEARQYASKKVHSRGKSVPARPETDLPIRSLRNCRIS